MQDENESIDTDLRQFEAGPSNKKLDDKAATLEEELISVRSHFNRERFLYHFLVGLLVAIVVHKLFDGMPIWFLISGMLYLLALAKFLDFPWVVPYLEKWLDLAYQAAEQKCLGKKPKEMEPLENLNEND